MDANKVFERSLPCQSKLCASAHYFGTFKMWKEAKNVSRHMFNTFEHIFNVPLIFSRNTPRHILNVEGGQKCVEAPRKHIFNVCFEHIKCAKTMCLGT